MSFNITSDGSPTPRKGPTRFSMAADLKIDTSPEVLGQAVGGMSQNHYPYTLHRSFGPSLTSNSQGMKRPLGSSTLGNQPMLPQQNSFDGYKKSKMEAHEESAVMDSLLQRLNGRSSPQDHFTSSSGSIPITPATDEFASTPSTEMTDSVLLVDACELQKLKLELQQARNEVDRMNQEMHSQHVARSTMEHLSQSSEADYSYTGDVTEQTLTQLQNKFNASTRANYGWGNEPVRPAYGGSNSFGSSYQAQPRPPPTQLGYRRNGFLNEPTHFPLDQSFRSSALSSGLTNGMSNSFTSGMSSGLGNGMNNPPSRPGSAFDPLYSQYVVPPMYTTGQMAPIGTMGSRLSPDATEFNVANGMGPSPWNSQTPSEAGISQYVPPAEPMNYRRLLDRNMSCNWKYIVDKIICNNDQQASIFLQQKLKVGTPEQKYEIVEAIISQAYALMVNRFGNFLVQRCFEHGTNEQIVAIAQAIRGNTLALSMDAFGCHVIQKAFDCVPEEYKATMVHELLRRIPETVIHRYACHVWQKLFELRWSDSPPQIMRYVNEALRGMWHEVALGETGSLVVQNIFENCLEEDKRPCINEVLASIDVIAHGQFGNWCIQHICEHGAPADRSRAIDHILRFATEYSTDQYASKVIEKCLKIGNGDFLDHYLERVCEGRPDRPRMPLIDIAGDQFGNYLIQHILTHSSAHHRELVGSHIRKHMVSLRGSKYGSRVAMLCCNPALATRPGPPAGMVPRYNNNNNPVPRTSFGAFR
ncbi:pumilio-family RNA binding repeat domain-containing protein [Cucurbitaria berberidis CBS 394.84]|uniref:Pumilio-family RNA binding repeat domain-containing protein n=1 Tax=Cucurbitaria berberidis CBS 394.84 TaxID=1168544 RepID=A0A9P4L781_9PLEO|nr:pumilio-family RNA binding repeat domain-containing protein [Cucurbitaria berberidis CBS 394.84]KAF1844655.1 pumilio-family RNA binding repeat domain-containing protein [Cucurbitaria berberidis CBS 394.84]